MASDNKGKPGDFACDWRHLKTKCSGPVATVMVWDEQSDGHIAFVCKGHYEFATGSKGGADGE